ncbi:MAG: ABC transporter permease subunit [Acidimicrobiaceae bacterium]|nr:ABC transporter permease subunit [Acidimicrobiaceae bacterium]
MTDIDVITDEHAPVVPVVSDAPVKQLKVKRRGRVTKWLAIGWLVFITVSAIGANSLPYIPHSCAPNEKLCSTAVKGDLRMSQLPPKWAWFADAPKPVKGSPERAGLMGTDKNGFDLFSRAMLGARNSLIIAGLAITFGLAIGTFLGMVAGYFRGWVDTVIENISNVLLAFPALLLAIFLVTFFNDPNTTGGASTRPLWPIILALVILSIPPLTRSCGPTPSPTPSATSWSPLAALARRAVASCSRRSCPTSCPRSSRSHSPVLRCSSSPRVVWRSWAFRWRRRCPRGAR